MNSLSFMAQMSNMSTSPRNILELQISICDAPLVQIFKGLGISHSLRGDDYE